MCVDFTSLNKACPKDDFPLPRISTLVDSAAGCEMLSLLDCFSGYHQIWMNREDEEKTSFITPSRTYCFRRMAEGLQNAGPTFARMTSVVFANDNSVSAYVDDIVVQSKLKLDHIADLRRTFAKLRTAKLKLNPTKCVFGVSKGKLLGCLVSARGIEANPAKIEAIRKMEPPTNRKLAKRLAGAHGVSQPLHPQVSGARPPLLRSPQKLRAFPLGASAAKSLRRLESIPHQLDNPRSPRAGRRPVTLRRGLSTRGQCRPRKRDPRSAPN
jgi:hypothetical protein